MLDGLRPVDGTHNANQAAAAKGRVAATAQSFIIPADSGIPPTPPPEVLRALDSVQRLANELRARGLDLRFDWSGGPEVTAQVVDAGGGLVREIPVVQALELLTGERPLTELRG